jgi:hypothetical protein
VQIESEKDFSEIRKLSPIWRKRFPMFKNDVIQIEKIVDHHIQTHSRIMVLYRQTHNKSYLEKAQREIDAINRTLATVEKLELMAMLSR